MTSKSFGNNAINIVNGNVGFGNTLPTSQLVVSGDTEVLGTYNSGTIIETGPYTALNSSTQTSFLAWLQNTTYEAKNDWWNSAIKTTLPSFTTTSYIYAGSLDSQNIYSSAVGAYAFERLFKEYQGPSVRLRRSDNQMIDVWFDKEGSIYQYQVVDTTEVVKASSINTWNGASVVYIGLWYDQSSKVKNLEQIGTTVQPIFEYDATLAGYAVKFTGTQSMSAPNAFGSDTISDMQLIMKVRETERTPNIGISFNGANELITRFSLALPWNDGIWYWDPADWLNNRAKSTASIIAVGEVAEVSAYKSSIENKCILNINTFSYSSVSSSAGEVIGGLIIGGFIASESIRYKGYFQYLITLNSKASDTITNNIFSTISPALSGSLDSQNIYTSAVGAYAFAKLFKEYRGPSVRLRRSDNQMIDVWFDKDGFIYQYQVVNGASVIAS